MPRIVFHAAGAILAGVLGCSSVRESKAPEPTAAPAQKPGPALHNVIQVTGDLISGSVPDGDAGFEELRAMGVKTIISVDGAAPDVERARAHGLRYVHLPVGYHGISPSQQLELARAVRDLEKPIYLHCHHGKHRGPAAAASAAVVLGSLTPEEGTALLEKAGTAPTYAGLYECVRTAAAAAPAAIDEAPAEFPETARTPGFVKAMAQAQDTYDHLVGIKDAGWAAPAAQPDLVPLSEAAQLENLLRSLLKDPVVATYPPGFDRMLADSGKLAQDLEDGIAAKAHAPDLEARLKDLGDACKSCHTKHRDAKDYRS